MQDLEIPPAVEFSLEHAHQHMEGAHGQGQHAGAHHGARDHEPDVHDPLVESGVDHGERQRDVLGIEEVQERLLGPVRAISEPGLDRVAEPAGEGVTQVTLTPVFELVHEFANQSAAAVGRDRAIEMQDAMLAIRATERLRDRPGKRLGTFRAKRRDDSRRSAAATLAEVNTPLYVSRADRAGRGIEE